MSGAVTKLAKPALRGFHLKEIKRYFFVRGGATVPFFKTQLRSVFPGPLIYFTDFIFCMVISYYHIRMGI